MVGFGSGVWAFNAAEPMKMMMGCSTIAADLLHKGLTKHSEAYFTTSLLAKFHLG